MLYFCTEEIKTDWWIGCSLVFLQTYIEIYETDFSKLRENEYWHMMMVSPQKISQSHCAMVINKNRLGDKVILEKDHEGIFWPL
jgi:hypothetical protein